MLVYIDGKTENHGELPKNRIFAGILSHCGAVCSSTLRTNNKPAAATGPLFTQFDSRNKIMNSLNTLMNCFLSRIFKILGRFFFFYFFVKDWRLKLCTITFCSDLPCSIFTWWFFLESDLPPSILSFKHFSLYLMVWCLLGKITL